MELPDEALRMLRMSASSRHQIRANAERWRDTGTFAQRAEAQGQLDNLNRLPEWERVFQTTRSSSERVKIAFERDPPSPPMWDYVQVLLDHPGLTSEGLTRHLPKTPERSGKKSQSWHLHFGTLCSQRQSLLGPPEPSVLRYEDDKTDCKILAVFSSDQHTWTMKREAVEGFALIGVVPRVHTRHS